MTLKLENVTKKFGSFTAVDNLSLEIPDNNIFGFLGANGAGKTTTFRMILNLLDQSSGSITWNGEKIDYSKSDYIGYLHEDRGLYLKLNVYVKIIYLCIYLGIHIKDIFNE